MSDHGLKRGTRVRLIRCSDPLTRMEPGTLGTVAFVDDIGTVFVDWDNDRGLGLIPGEDLWEVVS